MANLAELGNNIRRYCEENPEGDLNGFLQETALLTDIDNYNAQTQAVVMMTIHSAKGLEFPNVFIVGMEETRLCRDNSREEKTLYLQRINANALRHDEPQPPVEIR